MVLASSWLANPGISVRPPRIWKTAYEWLGITCWLFRAERYSVGKERFSWISNSKWVPNSTAISMADRQMTQPLEFTEWSLCAQHCALDLSPVLQRWTIRWYYLPKKGSLVREMLLHLRPAETRMNSLTGALLEEVKRKEESWECGWQLQGEMNEQLIQVSSWPRIWALGSKKKKVLERFYKKRN